MIDKNKHLLEGKFSFRDLVDIDRLRVTLERFSQATGLVTCLIALPDLDILVSTGRQDISMDSSLSGKGSEWYCRECGLKFTLEPDEAGIHHCRNGLIEGTSPIIVNGVHLATLFIGQVLFSRPDMDSFTARAGENGYDAAEYLKALGKVPVVREENFIKMIDFLGDMAVMFAEQGHITLQKREVARQARESEEKFRILAETSPLGIMLYREDNWIYANAMAEKICGYSLSELEKMHFWEFVAPEFQPLIRGHGRERQKGLQPGTGYEFKIITKTGEERWILLHGNTIKFEGEFAGIITTLDITERRRAEEELRKLQKFESIGTLAGGIAHDFNNILTGLFGNISLARDSIPEYNQALTYLDEAESAINRATRLTGQLLTFAKGGDPVKEDVSLGELIGEVARFDLSGSNVMPVFEYADDLWIANADKGQIQQVFSNLIINADQAMPEGGHLYINLENRDVEGNEVPNIKPGKYLRVSVRDEGSGIKRRDLSRVFDLYFSTRETGSGLGLATVYSIITRHGGHISVDSEPGKGTVFIIYLPASDSRQIPETEQPEAEDIFVIKTARILVMDDEARIRRVLIQMISRFGFTADSAADGAEMVEKYILAAKEGRPYDIIIMDLTVPGGMGGKEAVKKLLAFAPDAKVIVTSGYSTDPVIANFREYGFMGRLVKPFQLADLKKELVRVMEEGRVGDMRYP